MSLSVTSVCHPRTPSYRSLRHLNVTSVCHPQTPSYRSLRHLCVTSVCHWSHLAGGQRAAETDPPGQPQCDGAGPRQGTTDTTALTPR